MNRKEAEEFFNQTRTFTGKEFTEAAEEIASVEAACWCKVMDELYKQNPELTRHIMKRALMNGSIIGTIVDEMQTEDQMEKIFGNNREVQ